MNVTKISPCLKVITIDNSPLIAERMKTILGEIENLDFLGNAFCFSSAQNLINTIKPDVVILDIHLSDHILGLSGIDLLIETRQNYPEMKIIIFTNQNELFYRDVCIEKGADYFFDKSNDSYKVSEVLKQWSINR